jgi:hypothetical protein
MKVLLLLLLTLPIYGQSDLIQPKKPVRPAEADDKWKLAATTRDEPPVMWFYQRTRRVGRDVEVWLKIISPKPIKSPGYPPIIYSMNFTIFHCGTGRRTIEKTNVYDVKGRLIESFDPIKFGDHPREPVNPDSVEESLYQLFCSQ